MAATVLLAFALLFAVVGCTSTITPPAAPGADAITVFLIQDSRHLGLLLPRDDATFVEFGYGDWDWYAMEQDSWYHAFDTVLWPTQGTLARREIAARDGAGLQQRVPWATFDAILVARADAHALLGELEARFDRGRDRLHHSVRYGMDFVPDDDGYWCCFNCNDAVADWLRRLGCSVSWVPIRLGLAVARP